MIIIIIKTDNELLKKKKILIYETRVVTNLIYCFNYFSFCCWAKKKIIINDMCILMWLLIH